MLKSTVLVFNETMHPCVYVLLETIIPNFLQNINLIFYLNISLLFSEIRELAQVAS
jgi:hypothetical protein